MLSSGSDHQVDLVIWQARSNGNDMFEFCAKLFGQGGRRCVELRAACFLFAGQLPTTTWYHPFGGAKKKKQVAPGS